MTTLPTQNPQAPCFEGWLALRFSEENRDTCHVWMIPPEFCSPFFEAVGDLARRSREDWAHIWVAALATGLEQAFADFALEKLGFDEGQPLWVDRYDALLTPGRSMFDPLSDPSPRWAGLLLRPAKQRPARFGADKTLAWIDQRLREQFPTLGPTLGPFKQEAWHRLSTQDRADFFTSLIPQARAGQDALALEQATARASKTCAAAAKAL